MMSCIKALVQSKPVYFYEVMDYEGAGCLFTNKQLVLTGYQPTKMAPSISGIGGTKKPGETFQETAFRETIEELFNVEKIPAGLLEAIEVNLTPETIAKNDTYVFIVLSFNDLETILRLCKSYGLKTPMYKKFPLTLQDLIFKRLLDSTAEISHLLLIPMVKEICVDPYFVKDLSLI